MFISFLILYALLTVIVNYSFQYAESKGFDPNNVWVADIRTEKVSDESGKTTRELMDLAKKNILSIQGVSAVSNCSNNLPYGMTTASSSMKRGEIQHHNINMLLTDEHFHKVFQLDISAGSWYKPEDLASDDIPLVVNKEFKELFFTNENVVGERMSTGFNSDRYRIVGYIENFKIDGELSQKKATCFKMIGATGVANRLVIRTEEGAHKSIEEELVNTLTSTSEKWQINLKSMDVYKRLDFKRKLIPLLIFLSIAAFLVINIILGLFGTLLYNINQRKPEIGLRRSVGATTTKIYQQFVGEMLVLTTLGIIPGILIAIQFPLVKAYDVDAKIYLLSILASIAIIYLLVLISSLVPSSYAAKIQPVVALHEE
jgi:putative ABC transport system permease protein